MNAVTTDNLHQVYLSLGSNISPESNLPKAVDLLHTQLCIGAISTAWESPPYGGSGPNYINAIVLVFTDLEMTVLKSQVLLKIEAQLGRVRVQNPNTSREIDLDIVIYDDIVEDENIWERPYLAVPLAQLIPDYTHPVTHKTLGEIAEILIRNETIFPREDVLRFS